jgi:hypothetical protein
LASAAFGCAGLQHAGRLHTPQQKRLYVPVFVDETKYGATGVTLRDALRHAIFVRDPDRYCASFERDCWAFDGTVMSLRIEDASHPKKAVLQTHVRLVGHAENVELGTFRTEHVFQNRGRQRPDATWEMSLAKKAARDILARMESRAKGEQGDGVRSKKDLK